MTQGHYGEMKPYTDYSDFLARYFPVKMQKLTVDAGYTCPNRDGTLSRGGCIYCNNRSFSPSLLAQRASELHKPGRVAAQLEAGKAFFARKYPKMRYLAYFQSYTSTYAPQEEVVAMWREALTVEGVDGLVIGTRPDCLPDELLEELKQLNTQIFIEFGAETTHNRTLQLINRCLTWEQTEVAVGRCVAAGFPVGLHLIMGLPGETREMMMQSVASAAALPISTIKFHQLQVISGTTLAWKMTSCTNEVIESAGGAAQTTEYFFEGERLGIFSLKEYLDLCVEIIDCVNRINPSLAIERFTSSAPADMLLLPRWGLKNYEFVNRLNARLNDKHNARLNAGPAQRR